MMKLRLFLKNLARAALTSIILISIPAIFPGCSRPSSPTYTRENLSSALEKILKDEYDIAIVAKLEGQTLWIYLPLQESIFVDNDKPQEYTKRFEFDTESLKGILKGETFRFSHDIHEAPEAKETQKTKLNPNAFEKLNKVLRVLRRVIFSLKRYKYEPQFFAIVTADTISGIELFDINYIDDFKKASYEMISWVEYQHRTIEDIGRSPEAVGDLTGKHLKFYDIDFNEFLVAQIKQRIRIKFGRPEVNKGVDIDKEIIKSIRQVLEIYKFKDFSGIEIKNLFKNNKIFLSRASLMEDTKDLLIEKALKAK